MPEWLIWVAAAAGVTYVSRLLGVILSGRIDPGGALFEWVACVAYAILAGLVVRMILLPIGPLVHTAPSVRVIAAVIGVALFFITGRNLAWGVAGGVLSLMGLDLIS